MKQRVSAKQLRQQLSVAPLNDRHSDQGTTFCDGRDRSRRMHREYASMGHVFR